MGVHGKHGKARLFWECASSRQKHHQHSLSITPPLMHGAIAHHHYDQCSGHHPPHNYHDHQSPSLSSTSSSSSSANTINNSRLAYSSVDWFPVSPPLFFSVCNYFLLIQTPLHYWSVDRRYIVTQPFCSTDSPHGLSPNGGSNETKEHFFTQGREVR